jgi:D-threo-aldose 1-dehydrogenase
LHYDYGIAPQMVIDRVHRLEAHCERHGVALAAAALQFPLAHPQVASVIPGLGSLLRVENTLKLYKTRIPATFWHDLKNEGLIHASAPIPAPAADHGSERHEAAIGGHST